MSTVPVVFEVELPGGEGDAVYLTGDGFLGDWSPRLAIPLHHDEGTSLWRSTVDLQPGTTHHYRFLLKRGAKVVDWETFPPPMRTVCPPEGGAPFNVARAVYGRLPTDHPRRGKGNGAVW